MYCPSRKAAQNSPRVKAMPNGPAGLLLPGKLGDLGVRNANMGDFTGLMQEAVLDRPVLDQTEITGRYDFTLSGHRTIHSSPGWASRFRLRRQKMAKRRRICIPQSRSRSGSS